MHSTPRVALSLLLFFWTFGSALAQSEKQEVTSSGIDVVTAAANAEGVRFTAPNRVVQLRLEIYSELGQKLFDTEQRGGNVLDWQVRDSNGERVAHGTYLCVVTMKTLSGRLKQKLGLVTVGAHAASMRSAPVTELSSQQTEAVGPVDGDSALTIMPAGESLPATVLLHTGDEGQLSRTAGALSFRFGDFFSGKHKEQMRLTEEGNLGVGTDKPQAKLDVAGTIRTSEGIEFANGIEGTDATKVTKLTMTATGGLQQTLADGTVVPSATGTGTQNNIAKWTDNAGTLGDSSIFENASRNVGIGTTTPGAKLHVVGTQGSVGAGSFQLDTPTLFSNWTGAYPALEMVNTNLTNNNISLFQFADAPTGAAHAGIGAVNTSHTNKHGDLFFFTKQSDGYQMRMGIYGTNVGIGTTTPSAKLDVAGDVNTSTQYNLGGSRILSSGGSNNLFAGHGAGQANTIGSNNSFFGIDAGAANIGNPNDMDSEGNSFFGAAAGRRNTTGLGNSFFGHAAGLLNDIGKNNSFFGVHTGEQNTSGTSNAFFGGNSGRLNQTGGSNSFFGDQTGTINMSGSRNTLLGYQANVGSSNLTNATAIGANARVDQSDSLVLGSVAGFNFASASVNVGIGTTAPTAKLDIRVNQAMIRFSGVNCGPNFGAITFGNVALGCNNYSLLGEGVNTFINRPAGGVLTFRENNNDQMVIQSGGTVVIYGHGEVGGLLKLNQIDSGLGAGTVQLCRNASLVIAVCTSSSLRYKQQLAPFSGGLDLIRRLRPISFTWKIDGSRDLGLGAEDVAKVEPLLVTHNDKGEIEGVRYDRLNVLLINAIKHQQEQIEELRRGVRQLRAASRRRIRSGIQ